jgi:hypothetical protein
MTSFFNPPNFLGRSLIGAVGLGVALLGLPQSAKAISFPGKGYDTTTSLGLFQLNIASKFQPLFGNKSSITSPDLYDPSTTIGRSDAFLEGSSTDLDGALVGDGTHDQLVKDSDLTFPTKPKPPFPDSTNPNNREIHTEVYSVNLRELSKAADDPTSAYVHIGRGQGLRFSPGEIESLSGSGDPNQDFPASSFFNVYSEIYLGGGSNVQSPLYNSSPLIVKNASIANIPPTVVYIHDGTNPVEVLLRTEGSSNGIGWIADEVFGTITLSGHGEGLGGDCVFGASSQSSSCNSDIQTVGDAVAVPWETDALSVIGTTVLFGFGVWAKSKSKASKDVDLD